MFIFLSFYIIEILHVSSFMFSSFRIIAIVIISVLVCAKDHFEISLVFWSHAGASPVPRAWEYICVPKGIRFGPLGAQAPGCSGTFSNCPLFVSGVIPWARLLLGERT